MRTSYSKSNLWLKFPKLHSKADFPIPLPRRVLSGYIVTESRQFHRADAALFIVCMKSITQNLRLSSWTFSVLSVSHLEGGTMKSCDLGWGEKREEKKEKKLLLFVCVSCFPVIFQPTAQCRGSLIVRKEEAKFHRESWGFLWLKANEAKRYKGLSVGGKLVRALKLLAGKKIVS